MSCLVLPVSHPSETTSAAFNSMDLLLWEFDPDFSGKCLEGGKETRSPQPPQHLGVFPWHVVVAQLGRASVPPLGRASVPPRRGTSSLLPWRAVIPTCLKYLEFNSFVDICESHVGGMAAPCVCWTPGSGAERGKGRTESCCWFSC